MTPAARFSPGSSAFSPGRPLPPTDLDAYPGFNGHAASPVRSPAMLSSQPAGVDDLDELFGGQGGGHLQGDVDWIGGVNGGASWYHIGVWRPGADRPARQDLPQVVAPPWTTTSSANSSNRARSTRRRAGPTRTVPPPATTTLATWTTSSITGRPRLCTPSMYLGRPCAGAGRRCHRGRHMRYRVGLRRRLGQSAQRSRTNGNARVYWE